MSERSEAFKDYLLKRLGFKSDSFLENYVRSLRDRPDCSIISFLNEEILLKESKGFKKYNSKTNYISATDLATYTYCPIAYSISKTFEVEQSESAKKSVKAHEERRLINNLQTTFNFTNKTNQSFFNDINNSKLIYSGHSKDESKKYFINDEVGYIGQPDYIFQNSNGQNFIVEEKFLTKKKERFFDNHIVQLQSYIYLLNEFKANYGYLLYWSYRENYSIFMECNVYKINRESNIPELLYSAIENIKEFKVQKKLDLNLNSLNPHKCGGCVYCQCCGHKNKRFKRVNIPYKNEYLRLYHTEFPEILKKYFLLIVEVGQVGYILSVFNVKSSAFNSMNKTILNLNAIIQNNEDLQYSLHKHRKYNISEQRLPHNSLELESITNKEYTIKVIQVNSRQDIINFC